MHHPFRLIAAAALLLPPLLVAVAAPAAAAPLPSTYTLFGDPGGSLFEGIAAAPGRTTFYVSEVTGGEIHRGQADQQRTVVWIDEARALQERRQAAVGLATDAQGRLFVAGGDNRTVPGSRPGDPDVWIYASGGRLLAALRMPVGGELFLNDVVVGPDGAAYVTDSVGNRIFRVAFSDGRWRATLWFAPKPNSGPQPGGGFGLNGIEVSPDRKALVVAQTDAGILWRFDLKTRVATLVHTGNVDLTSTDGLVIRDHTLVAIRNFPQQLVYLRLNDTASTGQRFATVPTNPNRVFTTGDIVAGRLLLVDSQFDEDPPSRNSEVVARRFAP
jgi:sugar lactone lactonase YvrE